MKNVLALILAGGKMLHRPLDCHDSMSIYLFNTSDIIYTYEFMGKNRKEEKCMHDLRAIGGLRVNPCDVVVIPKVAEVK